MIETFEGILVFEDSLQMQQAVDLLESKGVLNDVFRYAVNYEQKLVVLPRAEYPGLSAILETLFEWVDPLHSHLDAMIIEGDIRLLSWDVHTQSFFELEGLELAEMFDDQADKDFFELSTDGIDGLSETEFVEKRNLLGKQAYERLPGYIESLRVNGFLEAQLSQT